MISLVTPLAFGSPLLIPWFPQLAGHGAAAGHLAQVLGPPRGRGARKALEALRVRGRRSAYLYECLDEYERYVYRYECLLMSVAYLYECLYEYERYVYLYECLLMSVGVSV